MKWDKNAVWDWLLFKLLIWKFLLTNQSLPCTITNNIDVYFKWSWNVWLAHVNVSTMVKTKQLFSFHYFEVIVNHYICGREYQKISNDLHISMIETIIKKMEHSLTTNLLLHDKFMSWQTFLYFSLDIVYTIYYIQLKFSVSSNNKNYDFL